tara:strand:- start:1241 stop:1588 length:348 start_codon:yes stop_codon:yes gene_type:complete
MSESHAVFWALDAQGSWTRNNTPEGRNGAPLWRVAIAEYAYCIPKLHFGLRTVFKPAPLCGVIFRSKGRSATAASAYRAAERVRDARTGEVHDYTRKDCVLHIEILASAHAPDWA